MSIREKQGLQPKDPNFVRPSKRPLEPEPETPVPEQNYLAAESIPDEGLGDEEDEEERFFEEDIKRLDERIDKLEALTDKLTDLENRFQAFTEYSKNLHNWSQSTEEAVKELQQLVKLLVARK